ncbi:D-alanine--D-alanine ligase [Dermacoccus nishinomiyaensis]|uniref:D-alanine--D-alanine ligase family protein n=1 Tax=Dermacoccus TaxID=57495 RepID=UPI0009393A21|nr:MULTISPECIES: D-alanine--D-alanine ligase family protein [Dermacoccus]QQY24054.1 D-alanine--D-alanine ligase [Dermacoccus nishinomiyaensis]TJZ98642.1 D-alanine--D-alanine ligase [Dermacoccus nishinomiyaensis]STD71103.1 D-alanine--D-alanine ligase [Dermacoccus nishinomiyaensis]
MSTSQPRTRVAVVFGGRSSEHAISCATAAGVLAAIDRERYDVVPIGISKAGQWVLMPDDPSALAIQGKKLPEVTNDAGREVVIAPSPDQHDILVLDAGQTPQALTSVDVVLPLLHGPFGEDGTLQGLLELADLRYVGSGVTASAVMMDKHMMKIVFEAAGLPVGPYVVITDKQWRRDKDAAMASLTPLRYPVFVKPARAGSSVGISKVDSRDQLEAAIELARESDPKVVIEAGIVGREVECGVLEGHGSDLPRASELGEIEEIGEHAFYDFEAKYLNDDGLRLACPADVSAEDTARIKELSIKAFDAAGCEGLARVDWFYTADGTLFLNEINTLPGFTPVSMFPAVWRESGLDYTDLITDLIELARERKTGLR